MQCCHIFVEDQLATPASAGDVYSIVLFDDNAEVVVQRMAIGQQLEQHLKNLEFKVMPGKGTCFGAAFEAVEDLAATSPPGQERLLVVFLSDGRPADFHLTHAKACRNHGKVYRNPLAVLTTFRLEYGDDFSFSTIGIHSDGFQHLQRLSSCLPGSSFQTVDLNMGMARASVAVPPLPALTVKQEASTSTVLSGPTSMVTSFLTLSSTLTSMRSSIVPRAEREVLLESGDAYAHDISQEDWCVGCCPGFAPYTAGFIFPATESSSDSDPCAFLH